MSNHLIKKSIAISASAHEVWRVFTDPKVSVKLGGHYVSAWKKGETLQWKGDDGKFYTYGIILELEPDKLIRHNLLDMKSKSKLISMITYTLEENGDDVLLSAEEELAYPMEEEQYEEALDGWDFVLETVKAIAEQKSK